MKMRKQIPYSKIEKSGKRLILRPYKFSDFKVLKASHDQRFKKINKFDEPVAAATEKHSQKFKERLIRYRKLAREAHQFIFGIFEKSSGSYIGQIDFLVINKQLSWGNLGYHIQNQYFKRGFATEAARIALFLAFNELNFHRIEASTETGNKASQKVARAAGLIFEGRRRKFFAEEGGIDMLVFATNAIDARRIQGKKRTKSDYGLTRK